MVRIRERSAGKYEGLNGGNFPAKDGRPPAFSITQKEWLTRSSAAMRAFVGRRPGGAKLISEAVECSPKTAQSWLDGDTAPSGILDKRAMNAIPDYAALCCELSAMSVTVNPRLLAKYREIEKLTLEIANGG